MLLQNSLPNLIGSNCAESWRQSPKCDECREVICSAEEESSISTKELCTLVLKRHGLLEGVSITGACGSQEDLHVANSRPCKICGRLEDLVKMLICDLCEASFHVSCCNPRIKKLLVDDEWICHPCFKKRPKSIGKKNSKKPVDVSEASDRWKRSNLGPILYMLRTNALYTSGVRIGKDFQAEVLPWSGPLYDDCNYFGQSMELDPAERASRNDSKDITPSNSSSVGNWLQCRNVIYKDADESDEGTVCGKWRRAPLFAIQTDDWDCSCAVVWDPIHADCAVPQELETDMVLKNLKYVEMLNRKLAHKQSKYVETGSGSGPE